MPTTLQINVPDIASVMSVAADRIDVRAADYDPPADLWEALQLAVDGYLSEEELDKLEADLEKFPALHVGLLNKTYPNIRPVYLDGKYMIVEDLEAVEPSGWVNGAGSIKEEIAEVLAERFNADEQAHPAPLYHATQQENIDEIMADGLRAENRTRGLTNRSVGPSIFTTSLEGAQTGSYGDSVIQIDLSGMKRDGVEYYATQEPAVVERTAAEVLASILDIDDYDYPGESDGADDPDTVILYCANVPPKYLKIISE